MIVLVKSRLFSQVRKHVDISRSFSVVVPHVDDLPVVVYPKDIGHQPYQVPRVFLGYRLIFQINLSDFLHDFWKLTGIRKVQNASHYRLDVVVIELEVLVVVEQS